MELNIDGSKIGGRAGGSDLSLWGTSLNVLGVMNRDAAFSPYLIAGAGALQNDRSPGSDATDLMAQAGVGELVPGAHGEAGGAGRRGAGAEAEDDDDDEERQTPYHRHWTPP